jgi:hypothetical protein
MTSLRDLAWHLQLVVYRGIGRDGMHALGVRPGKLEVPEALREALGRSFKMRRDADAWIPIAGSSKVMRVTMTEPVWLRIRTFVALVVVVDTDISRTAIGTEAAVVSHDEASGNLRVMILN